MTHTQIEKLYTFYFLYNGIDRKCNLLQQSPDYLLEKWDKLIGIEGNETKYPELQESKLYQEWEKIWLRGKPNPIPDNIMMFLIKTHPQENNRKYCQFLKLCKLFQNYIGKTSEITQDEYNHIHPLLVEIVKEVINSTIDREDLREVLLNNMLS